MCAATAERKLPRRFRVGDWQIDQLQGIIQKGDEIARLRPLAMRFLVCLAEHAPEPVTTNELVERVWAPRIVSDDSVYVAVRELRRILGDDARHPQYIETLTKRGVRIVAQVGVIGAKDAVATVRPPESTNPRVSPFVGRADVLARLESCFESAVGRRGQVVFIAGEPGIGKTRTAQEFADRVEARGAAVYSSWCEESLVAPPYWPWVRLLRSILDGANPKDHVGRDACAMLATILPDIRQADKDIPDPPEFPAERMAFELAQAIAALIARVAQQKVLVLMLDDVHRADQQSLSVLRVMAREIARARVVLVCTYRDVEVQRLHPLAEILVDLGRLGHYERAVLRGLARDDVAILLARAGSATRVLDPIMSATDGNSLFVTEIIRSLVMQADRADEATMLLPQSLREVIIGRLRHLSDECRRAVDIAAVIGHEFDPETIESVGGFDDATVDRAVDEALRAGVYTPASPGALRFAHALIRDAIYGEIPRRKRIAFHRAIAESLVASFDPHRESGGYPEAIAHHFQEAGQTREAIDYWEQAANIALRRSAHGEQIRRLEQALKLLETLRSSRPGERGDDDRQLDEREVQFRLALGNAHSLVGGGSAATVGPEFARALEICNLYDDAPELERARFQAVNGLWGHHIVRGDTEETQALVKLQSQIAERTKSESYLLLASNAEAIARFFEGDYAHSLEALDVATRHYDKALARRISKGTTTPWRSSALMSPLYYAWCLAIVGRAETAREVIERSVREAKQLGTFAYVESLSWATAICEMARDVERANDIASEMVELAEKFGFLNWIAIGRCVRGWARSHLGELEAGLAEIRLGFAAYRATGATLSLSSRTNFLAETLCRAGLQGEAVQLIDETLASNRGRIEHFFDAELFRTRGVCVLTQGDVKAAQTWFGRALELAGKQGARLFELRAATSLLRCKPTDRAIARRLRKLKDELGTGICEADARDASEALSTAHS